MHTNAHVAQYISAVRPPSHFVQTQTIESSTCELKPQKRKTCRPKIAAKTVKYEQTREYSLLPSDVPFPSWLALHSTAVGETEGFDYRSRYHCLTLAILQLDSSANKHGSIRYVDYRFLSIRCLFFTWSALSSRHMSYYHPFGKVFTYIPDMPSSYYDTNIRTYVHTCTLLRAGPISLPFFSKLIAVHDFILYPYAHHG